MELIIADRQFELPAEISNLEEIRQWLMPKLEFYKSLVVTENGIKSAKSDKAELNRLRKVIDDKRKEIKKAYLKPYNVIEDECRKITALIDEPIKAIDEQIKAFENAEIQAKREVLEKFFSEENTFGFLTLDDVVNPKWKNKTEKAENLTKEIGAKISEIKTDFEDIQNMYSDSALWTAISGRFAETKGNKFETLAYAVTLERRYQTAQRENVANAAKTDCEKSNIITPVLNQNAVSDDYSTPQMISGTFKVTCTEPQLIALRDFMKDNDISFEVVK